MLFIKKGNIDEMSAMVGRAVDLMYMTSQDTNRTLD